MLQLSGTIINQPVLSLRTGSPVATATAPIINPNNLKIEGFFCQLPQRKQLILVSQDIRDVLPQGIVVNDVDVLADAHELVRLQPIINLNFSLLNKQVVTVSKHKVGKVTDFSTDTSSMFIQKLYVSQPLWRNPSGGNLGVDRTQIVEINGKEIVINDLEGKVLAGARAVA